MPANPVEIEIRNRQVQTNIILLFALGLIRPLPNIKYFD